MRNDDVATYEKWDMTAPIVPPRSRFFNLSPAGLGTSMVECLTSYLSRLAQAHSVTPGVLHHREVMKYGATRRNMFGVESKLDHVVSLGASMPKAVAASFVSALGR